MLTKDACCIFRPTFNALACAPRPTPTPGTCRVAVAVSTSLLAVPSPHRCPGPDLAPKTPTDALAWAPTGMASSACLAASTDARSPPPTGTVLLEIALILPAAPPLVLIQLAWWLVRERPANVHACDVAPHSVFVSALPCSISAETLRADFATTHRCAGDKHPRSAAARKHQTVACESGAAHSTLYLTFFLLRRCLIVRLKEQIVVGNACYSIHSFKFLDVLLNLLCVKSSIGDSPLLP